jgi:hypothetical protein
MIEGKMKKMRIGMGLGLAAVLLIGTPALSAPVIQTSNVSASSLLSQITVASEALSSSYKRTSFRHWIDADSNGCDTRRDVLAAESTKPVNCRTLSGGLWVSAFDGAQTNNASGFDVDHMVPLKEAWESGAHSWDSATRTSFANDLAYEHSLIAVSAKSNRSKSDRDPNNWMPPTSSFHCQYVGRWIAVKYRWTLSVDASEKTFLESKVASCGAAADVLAPQKAPIAAGQAPAVQSTPAPTQVPQAGTHPKFSSCAEAARNGFRGPYVRGINPEYAWYQDRDKDGSVCE